MELTERQIKLAEQLLISVQRNEPYIEYNELAARINPPMFWRQVGREIGEVSILCNELGLPLLSAKVVSKGQRRAGDGFFEMMKTIGRYDRSIPEREQFLNELEAIRECKEWYKLEEYLGLSLGFPRPDQKEQKTETQEIIEKDVKFREFISAEEVQGEGAVFAEGAVKQIVVNTYERNPVARRRCLEIHGTKCAICGFDFAEFYGLDFEGLIHIHHLKPIHTIGEEYEVDPATDLIPVCPNCHLAVHSKRGGVYPPEELRKYIRLAAEKSGI